MRLNDLCGQSYKRRYIGWIIRRWQRKTTEKKHDDLTAFDLLNYWGKAGGYNYIRIEQARKKNLLTVFMCGGSLS